MNEREVSLKELLRRFWQAKFYILIAVIELQNETIHNIYLVFFVS